LRLQHRAAVRASAIPGTTIALGNNLWIRRNTGKQKDAAWEQHVIISCQFSLCISLESFWNITETGTRQAHVF
jgi:hypothetical protein